MFMLCYKTFVFFIFLFIDYLPLTRTYKHNKAVPLIFINVFDRSFYHLSVYLFKQIRPFKTL